MHFKYIAVEGNIGAGKTTLVNLLSQNLDADAVYEEFEDIVFLQSFYEDQKQVNTLGLEFSFLWNRYQQLLQTTQQSSQQHKLLISDYTFEKSLLFARKNLSTDEYALFEKYAQHFQQQLPPPNLVIFLETSIADLKRNITKRGRPYEQSISEAYLLNVEIEYQKFIQETSHPIIVLNTQKFDSTHLHQLQQLIDFITQGNELPESWVLMKRL